MKVTLCVIQIYQHAYTTHKPKIRMFLLFLADMRTCICSDHI